MGTRGIVGIAALGGLLFVMLRVNAAFATLPPDFPFPQLDPAESALTRFVTGLGIWAFVAAPLLMIVVAILPIPAEIPAMLNGVVFGPVVGTLVSWSGALVGAAISFELARRGGRPLVHRFVNHQTMARADTLVQSAGWPMLLILRLIPTIAFTAINWTAGLTSLSRPTFLWTTAVGIIPGAVLFTVSGSGLAALYRMNPLAGWSVAAAGLAVIAWTVVRLRREVHRPEHELVDR